MTDTWYGLTNDDTRVGYRLATTSERKLLRMSMPEQPTPKFYDAETMALYTAKLTEYIRSLNECCRELRRGYERARSRGADKTARFLWGKWHSFRTVRGMYKSEVRSFRYFTREAKEDPQFARDFQRNFDEQMGRTDD